jgi:dUTP pyrophosphatase
MKIKIVRIEKDLPLPEYQTSGAVAFDLYSRVNAAIPPKELAVLPSNFIIEVPEGYFLMIASRSSTPRKKGLTIANGIGVVDQDYHGPKDEIGILVYNFTGQTVSVERGERIAQGLILPVLKVEFNEADVIKEDSRGGFGSTG